jgi:hypothetical protein
VSIDIDKICIPPYRVGKKQKRTVLNGKGHEVVVFPKGLEIMAEEFCQFLNNKDKKAC